MRIIFDGFGVHSLKALHEEAIKARVTRIDAAVAFAGDEPQLFRPRPSGNLSITFLGRIDGVSPKLLRRLLSNPSVRCRLVTTDFHAKVLHWHGFGAYVGSANLTWQAWERNVECGVFWTKGELEELKIRSELDALFASLTEASVPLTAKLVAAIEKRGEKREDFLKKREEYRDELTDLEPSSDSIGLQIGFFAQSGRRQRMLIVPVAMSRALTRLFARVGADDPSGERRDVTVTWDNGSFVAPQFYYQPANNQWKCTVSTSASALYDFANENTGDRFNATYEAHPSGRGDRLRVRLRT